MRVLISVAVWGRKYAALLVNYSIASQLSRNNIPLLSTKHDVTYHIVTTASEREWLGGHPLIHKLEQHCRVVWELMENHGIRPNVAPAGFNRRKYPFLSWLQNLSFSRARDYDAIVFNYADFVWSDGSLTNAVSMLDTDAEAVLSFCLPVDQSTGTKAIEGLRMEDVLDIAPRDLARISLDHLHREARLRFWNSRPFTAWPTYLLWPVKDEGIVIRAYHQTVLVLRVRHDDPQFFLGIPRGSLDGHFTSIVAARGRFRHAVDSDRVMVCSLHQSYINTRLRNETPEQAIRRCLAVVISNHQRRFAEVPIRIKAGFHDVKTWEAVETASGNLLIDLHNTTPFDQEAHDSLEELSGNLESALQRGTILGFVYRHVAAHLSHSVAGAAVKRLMGDSARRLRLTIERWIYRR